MSASDYDFLLTRNELITEAFRKIGILADGEDVTAEQLDTGSKKLNLIIKAMGEDGVHLFSYIKETVSLVVSTANYALPTDNGLSIVDRIYITENATDLPLSRMDFWEYEELYDKNLAGKPQAFTQSPSDNSIYLYPVPEKVYSIKVLGIRKLKDWTDANSTGEFPARWLNAIKYALAVELAEDCTCPINQIQYLRSVAREEYLKARGKSSSMSDTKRMRGAY